MSLKCKLHEGRGMFLLLGTPVSSIVLNTEQVHDKYVLVNLIVVMMNDTQKHNMNIVSGSNYQDLLYFYVSPSNSNFLITNILSSVLSVSLGKTCHFWILIIPTFSYVRLNVCQRDLTLSIKALYHCTNRRASQFPGGILSWLQIKIFKSCVIQTLEGKWNLCVRKPMCYFIGRTVTTENWICPLSGLGILSLTQCGRLVDDIDFWKVTCVCASLQTCKSSCYSQPEGVSCLTNLTFLRGLFYV